MTGLVAVGQPFAGGWGDGEGQAGDGLDFGRAAGFVEGDRAVEGVGVGQGQVGHLFGRGAFDQCLNGGGCAEEGIVGVDFEVGEGQDRCLGDAGCV